MTFFKRLFTFFSLKSPAILPTAEPAVSEQVPVPVLPVRTALPANAPPFSATQFNNETLAELLPNWLSDDDSLRDEGTLFGLSMARPDDKIAAIRAYFGQSAVMLQDRMGEYAEAIGELNGTITQRQTRLDDLENRVADLHNRQPPPDTLIRTIISLSCLVGLGIGTFCLIDEALRPVFPNRWIAVGVFLAGMLNGLVRASFGSDQKTASAGWRLMQEGGVPLASAGFVLAQVWQTQPVLQCIALFVFIFFVFWQGGKRLFDTLTLLNQDMFIIAQKRSIALDRRQNVPIWEAERERLRREIDVIRAEKRPLTTALNRAETELAQLNTRRDRLVNLFLSEFELARSLRDQLSNQQRETILKSFKVA